MARPKLGDSETERLHVKMTADEIAEIDEWQHDNRIQNRSEAVRRLVQIALRTTKALPKIATDIEEVLDLAAEAIDIPEDVLADDEFDDVGKVEVDRAIAMRLYDSVNFTFNRQFEAQDNFYHLMVEIAPLANNPAINEALKTANELATAEFHSEAVLTAVGSPRRAQLDAWRRRRQRIEEKRATGGAKGK